MTDQDTPAPVCVRHETLDEIDASVNAITDDEIRTRLDELLASEAPDPDTPATGEGLLLTRRKVDLLLELDALTEAVARAKRDLRAIRSQTIAANERKDELNRAAARAQIRLDQARQQLAVLTPGATAYLDAVSTRSREILDSAHKKAQEIINDADDHATVVRGKADFLEKCRNG